MHALDFTPLMRSSIGFDRLSHLLDAASRNDLGTDSYPPYNIEKMSDDEYRITLAVAGFSQSDIEIVAENGVLTVTGEGKNEGDHTYLHQGIAARSFKRRYQLAEYIKVTGASMDNGLLQIDLEREIPDALKPRTIEICDGGRKKIAANESRSGKKAA